MHKGCDCETCIKLNVCKIMSDYNNTALSLNDTNTDFYVSKLICKEYEKRVKYDNKQ